MPADPTPGRPDSHGAHAASLDAGESHGAPRLLARAALRDVPWEVGVAKPDPVIVVDEVTRSFGGLTAVSVDHMEVQRGGITGLIGPNGAGKTTLFNLLIGAQGQKGESFFRALVPGTWRAQERANTEKAMELLTRFKLDRKKDDFAGTLSGGQ